MATVKFKIRAGHLKKDGSYPIEWFISNTGYKSGALFGSGHFIPKDFTKKDRKGITIIADKGYQNFMEEEQKKMVEKVNRITVGNRNMSPLAIKAQLLAEEKARNLDFLEFCDNWIINVKKKLRGWGNYQSAVNAFRTFVQSEKFDVQEIDSKLMRKFEDFLSPSPYKQNRIREEIARLYEEMRTEYNDYDRDFIVIPDRLQNWRRTKKKINVPLPDKRERTLTVDNIRQIANAEFEQFEMESQKIMLEAREVFLLSFCLMGINLQDLWTMPASCLDKGSGTIIYNRSKTGVHSEVVVPNQIKGIFEKYMDKKGKYLFDFCYRSTFKENTCYRQRINKGLKMLANKLCTKQFTFYAARHTIANIARQQKISKETVDTMLQHTSPYKTLNDHYAEETYAEINEANEKIMNFVFGDNVIKTFEY